MELFHDLFVCTNMRTSFIVGAVLFLLIACSRNEDKTPLYAEQFSVDLLQQIQNEKPYRKHLDSLEFASVEALQKQLVNDQHKKAFWINLYNSFVQIKIKENPTSYQNTPSFFDESNIVICGMNLSLNEIHFIFLSGDKVPQHLTDLENLKVTKKDSRVLFALNCGSVSCPPIAFYDSEKIDLQLELAESVFVKSDCSYDPFADVAEVPELMKQLSDDSSSDQSILSLLKKHGIVPVQANPELIFTPYNWSPQLPEFR